MKTWLDTDIKKERTTFFCGEKAYIKEGHNIIMDVIEVFCCSCFSFEIDFEVTECEQYQTLSYDVKILPLGFGPGLKKTIWFIIRLWSDWMRLGDAQLGINWARLDLNKN